MPVDRATLHLKHLEGFAAHLESLGWKREALKGGYEVLRMKKDGRKTPLILYARNGGQHATFPWDAYDIYNLMVKWVRDSRGAKRREGE